MSMCVEINNGDKPEAFTEFTVVSAGVIVEIAKHSEMFFPWHKVNHIMSTERGTIATQLPL